MELDEKYIRFIENNIELIEQDTLESWNEFFKIAIESQCVNQKIGTVLKSCGADPFKHAIDITYESLWMFPQRHLELKSGQFVEKFALRDLTDVESVYVHPDVAFEPITGSVPGLFNGSVSLKHVEFNDEYVYAHMFYNCPSLQSVVLGPNVKYVGYKSFAYCPQLQHVVLGPNVQFIGHDSFCGCKKLECLDYLGDINGRALIGADYPMSKEILVNGQPVVDIHVTNASKVSNYSFIGSNSLKTVKLDDCVKYIGAKAFKDCRLEKVQLGRGIQDIGEQAFAYTYPLKEIQYDGTVSEAKAICLGNRRKTAWRAHSSLKQIVCADGVIPL